MPLLELTARFDEALVWASELHRGQVRKRDGGPYIAHLLMVAALVIEHGGDEDEAIAALLHDAIEDQGGDSTRQQIRLRFGERVTAIVDGCTDSDEEPKAPWRERKQQFVERLGAADRSVRLVVAADKLHNASSTLADLRRNGQEVWSRFRGGREGSLWYYRSVLEALEVEGPEPLVSRLRDVVDALSESA